MNRTKLKYWWFRVIAVVVGMVVLLAGLGVTVAADKVVGWWLNKSGYFVALPPGLTIDYDTSEFRVEASISSQGLRDEEMAIPKPAGVTRILAVGDSFTYGWGVATEETWPEVLEDKLKQSGFNVEVINAGVPGAGPSQERQVCRAYADRLEADAIIMQVYTDDLYQAGAREERLSWWDEAKVRWWPVLSRLKRRVLSEYEAGLAEDFGQRVYTPQVWRKVAQTLVLRNPQLLNWLSIEVRQEFLDGKLNPALISRAAIDPEFLTLMLDEKRLKFSLEVVAKRLERLRQRCSSKDLPVWLVFIPGSSLVSEESLIYKEALGYRVDPALNRFPMDDYLRPVVERIGFEYESLLANFRTDGCPGCFYPYDGHLTAVGQQRVADYVVSKLLGPGSRYLDL